MKHGFCLFLILLVNLTQVWAQEDGTSKPLQVRLYGNIVNQDQDFRVKSETKAKNIWTLGGNNIYLVCIEGWKIGKVCFKPEQAYLWVLFTEGKKLEHEECGFTAPTRVWVIPKDQFNFPIGIGAIPPTTPDLEEFISKKVSGGIKFINPRYENGKLCVDINVWGKGKIGFIKFKFNKTIPVCIPIAEACYTYGVGEWASIKVCLRLPNLICVKLYVIRIKVAEKCVRIPIPKEKD